MQAPTNRRDDNSIQNVILMLRPVLDKLELVGKTITAAELAKICRRHHRRLPMRSYASLRMAEELNYLTNSGGVGIGDLSVLCSIQFDPYTRRRKAFITFERAWLDEPSAAQNEAEPSAPKPDESIRTTTG